MKRKILVLAAALVAVPHLASAQFSSGRSSGRMPDNAIRITAKFNTLLPLSGVNETEHETAKTKARARLYELAQRECELLTAVFSSQCKIVSINVNASEQNQAGGLNILHMNISASYTITPKE
ncbi:MAG: hypothetical protein FJX29_11450 [Alphaproteobacteria bacterium]|nr:hypothetical protein [Alphaproteobacteria bacterium]